MTESNEVEYVQIGARVPKEMHTSFSECADKCGMSVSALARELFAGFIEGRVTLTPPKHVSDLYSINTSKE